MPSAWCYEKIGNVTSVPGHCRAGGFAVALIAALAQCSSTPQPVAGKPAQALRVLIDPTPANYQIANDVFRKTAVFKPEFLPTPAGELIAALNAGRGDVIANLIVPPEREEPTVDLVPAITGVREVVATGPNEKRLVSLEDLEGRRIHVAKNSRHFASLERLNQQMAKINKPGCTIVGIDGAVSDDDLLKMVNDGKIPATLVDSHVADAVKFNHPGISINNDIAVSQDIVVAWATRRDSLELRDKIRAILKP